MPLVDRWFQVFEDIGESPFIRVAKIHQDNQKFEITDVHHSEGDGFSTFVGQLKKHGWQGNPEDFIFPRKKPSRWQSFRSFWTYLASRSNIQVPWKKFAQNGATNAATIARFYGFSWSREDSQKILASLQEKNLSFNDLLIGVVDQCVRQKLLTKSDNIRTSWWIPVDMRPYGYEGNPFGNRSSHISLHLMPEDGPSLIKIKKRDLFHQGYHLAAWWWLNLLACMPYKVLKQMLLVDQKQSRWCGTISNMGRWNREDLGGVLPAPWVWSGTPMPMQTHPLAFGTIEYCGVLSISLSVHPCLELSPMEEQEFFSQIVSSCASEA